MKCEACGRESHHLRYVHVDGKLVGGCDACANKMNPSLLSTEKRWHHGPGYDFWASAAHIDDIRHRKIGDDGRTVTRNRR